MNKDRPDKAEFDQYAAKYQDLHRASTAGSGEEPEYFAEYKTREVARRLGDASKRELRILDFGTGIGGAIPHLWRHFPAADIFGTDVSSESIRLATEQYGMGADFTSIRGSTLDYETATFDVAFAACVFHHIPVEDRSSWMTELCRVLKPGGHLFVFEHNPLNPLTVKVVKDCSFDEDAILLHRNELKALAFDAGFETVEARYIVFFPKALSLFRPLEPAMAWLPLGAQYYIHAKA